MNKKPWDEWVERARAGEKSAKKYKFMRLHYEDDLTYATDGYRLHAVNKGDGPPAFKHVIQEAIESEEAISLYVDPQMLRDALPDEDESTTTVGLRVTGSGSPIEIYWLGKDGVKHYAMIMPVKYTYNQSDVIKWRPYQNEEE